jgi:hypothetical protein
MLRTQYALIIAGWPRPAGQLGPIRIRPYSLQMWPVRYICKVSGKHLYGIPNPN